MQFAYVDLFSGSNSAMHHFLIQPLATTFHTYEYILGLPDGRYFTGLAGILLLIYQRLVKSRYFENQC